MNTFEVIVTLTPDQLSRVKGRDDHEEEHRAALNSLQHEVSNWPDLNTSDSTGEFAVVHREDDQEADNRPEGDITNDKANSETAQ